MTKTLETQQPLKKLKRCTKCREENNIERESREESKESQRAFVKYLMLVVPELAQLHGVPTEGPVFYGLSISGDNCPNCRLKFEHLVYQVGYVTEQPSNKKCCTEIFYCNLSSNEEVWPEGYARVWVTIIEPVGDRVPGHFLGEERAKGILVKSISAYCEFCRSKLEEGVVFRSFAPSQYLLPYCSDTNCHSLVPEQTPLYNFRITETGEVVFRQV